MSDDAFKNAVLAPTPAPYDPNAKHTLAEKIAHAVDVVKDAVVHAGEVVVEKAEEVLHVGKTDWEGATGYTSLGAAETEIKAIVADVETVVEDLAEDKADPAPTPVPTILTHFGESDKASPETDKVMATAVAGIATADTETKTPDSAA